MIRTQIYLTERQSGEIKALSKRVGKKQSELIREALDQYLDRQSRKQREKVLRSTAGIWSHRTDLPDFGKIRGGWDRSGS